MTPPHGEGRPATERPSRVETAAKPPVSAVQDTAQDRQTAARNAWARELIAAGQAVC